jgi:hypothetical protein
VAIGRRPLVNPELRSGVLVQAGDRIVASATSYWLVGPAVSAFRLIDEMSHIRRASEVDSPADE